MDKGESNGEKLSAQKEEHMQRVRILWQLGYMIAEEAMILLWWLGKGCESTGVRNHS